MDKQHLDQLVNKTSAMLTMESVKKMLSLFRRNAREVDGNAIYASYQPSGSSCDGVDIPSDVTKLWLLYMLAGFKFRTNLFNEDMGADPILRNALEGPDGDLLYKYYPGKLSLRPRCEFSPNPHEYLYLCNILEEIQQHLGKKKGEV